MTMNAHGAASSALGAARVELTSADLREIDAAFANVTVHGGRMNAEQMKVVDETK